VWEVAVRHSGDEAMLIADVERLILHGGGARGDGHPPQRVLGRKGDDWACVGVQSDGQ
jgi:hypothetical protein